VHSLIKRHKLSSPEVHSCKCISKIRRCTGHDRNKFVIYVVYENQEHSESKGRVRQDLDDLQNLMGTSLSKDIS